MQSIELKYPIVEDLSTFHLGENIHALDFFPDSSEERVQLGYLPFGQCVKYMRIQQEFHNRQPLIVENIILLKKRFPKLQFLVLPYGSKVEVAASEIGFEVHSKSKEFEKFLQEHSSIVIQF